MCVGVQFSVDGSTLGFVPVVICGLTAHYLDGNSGLWIRTEDDVVWSRLDQHSQYNNDYWQTNYVRDTESYEIIYNVELFSSRSFLAFGPEPETSTAEIAWTAGFGNPDARARTFAAGTLLQFQWEGTHNVHILPNLEAFTACNFTSATILGAQSGVEFQIPSAQTEKLYFACKVNSHCLSGQKLAVTIIDDVPTIAPSASPSTEPTQSPTQVLSESPTSEPSTVPPVLIPGTEMSCMASSEFPEDRWKCINALQPGGAGWAMSTNDASVAVDQWFRIQFSEAYEVTGFAWQNRGGQGYNGFIGRNIKDVSMEFSDSTTQDGTIKKWGMGENTDGDRCNSLDPDDADTCFLPLTPVTTCSVKFTVKSVYELTGSGQWGASNIKLWATPVTGETPAAPCK